MLILVQLTLWLPIKQAFNHISHPIRVANNSVIFATEKGTLSGSTITLNDVLVCKDVAENLLSVSSCADQGYDTLFTKDKVYIGKNFSPGNTIIEGPRIKKSYYIDVPIDGESNTTYYIDRPDVAAQAFLSTLDDLHLKYSHLNEKDLLKLIAK
ncbi:hypothetical protein HK103_004377, partial [Boothiomyces macroporosus]